MTCSWRETGRFALRAALLLGALSALAVLPAAGEEMGEAGGSTTDTDTIVRIDRFGGAVHIEKKSADLVRMGSSLKVEADRIIEGDAVAIGGNADIFGRVEGDAVVIGGVLHLYPGARVGGDAVAVGGRLVKEEGATVEGEEVSIGSGLEKLLPWGARTFLMVFFVFFGFLAILVFVELFGRQTARVAAQAHQDYFRSGLAGLLGLFLTPVSIFLLVITLIGILFLPVLGVLIGVAFLWGYVAVSLATGRTVGRKILPGVETARWRALIGFVVLGVTSFVGHLLIGIGGPFHFLGWTFLIAGEVIIGIAFLIGFGAVLMTRFGRRGHADRPACEASGEGLEFGPAGPAAPGEEGTPPGV